MNTYSNTEKRLYLTGLMGQNIIYGIITSLFAYYIQFTLLIPAVWVGIILTSSRIFDAVKDLFIGSYISKKQLKSGKLKPYLILLPLPTAIVTILCFLNKIYNTSEAFSSKNIFIIAFTFIIYLIWEIIFTFGDIPITSYPTVMTNNETDKNRLLTLRPVGSIASSITVLIAQPMAFAIGEKVNSEQQGFMITVIILSVIGGILFQLTAVKSKERVNVSAENTKNTIYYFIKNKILKKIFISGILGSLKSTAGVVMTPLVSYYFAVKDPAKTLVYTGLLGAGNFVGMIISMAITPKLKNKYNSRTIFVYSNLINAAPNILIFIIYLLNKNSMTGITAISITVLLLCISGTCGCVSNTVQTMLLSEALDLEERISKTRPEALFFSCNTFIIKIASGISSMTASLGYSIIHFSSAEIDKLNHLVSSGAVVRTMPEYENLMTMLFFMLTVPVAVSSVLCTIPFMKKDR